MADVFRPTYHADLPPDAKIIVKGGERHARFRNARGRIVEGPILPNGKVRARTDEYWGRIRYADGRTLRVKLHVTDQEAARQLRAQKQREADQQKAGIIDAFEQHRHTPLIGVMTELPKRTHERSRYGKIIRHASELARHDLYAAIEGSHLAAYVTHLKASGRTARHIDEVARTNRRTAIGCDFEFSSDLNAGDLERYLSQMTDKGLSSRTRNASLKGWRAMTAWMIRAERLDRDPFRTITVLNEEADAGRRVRRALTPGEFEKLLNASETSNERIEGIDGPQRAVLFMTAAWTGLRRKELGELMIAHLSLHSEPPFVHIPAAATKARRDDHPIPLHPFVAKRLSSWIKQRREQGKSTLFDLKTRSGQLRKTSKLMRLDCEAAEIPYVGDLGVADFHSHRLAFITHLSRTCRDFSLVSELARHRDPKLTAKIYDKVRLEDRTAAISGMTLPTGGTSVAGTKGKGANRSRKAAAKRKRTV
jgi:integrase